MSAISSSIFGDSDCTLAVSTFSRLLGCINQPVFVGGSFPLVMTAVSVEYEVLFIVAVLGVFFCSC